MYLKLIPARSQRQQPLVLGANGPRMQNPIFGVWPKAGTGGTRNHSSVYGTVVRSLSLNVVGKLSPAAS